MSSFTIPVRAGLLTLASTALLLSGCSAATETTRADTVKAQKITETFATVKPGAALEFSSEIDGLLSAGSYTDVIVTLKPAYFTGVLSATARGSDGLEVLSSHTDLRHNMSDGAATWRIAVRPQDDGLHYLHILANVSGSGFNNSVRAFAVAVDPGGKSEAAKSETMKISLSEQADGPALAIMEAEETILPQK